MGMSVCEGQWSEEKVLGVYQQREVKNSAIFKES